MEMTLRWYGSKFDTVTLKQIRQIPGFLVFFLAFFMSLSANFQLMISPTPKLISAIPIVFICFTSLYPVSLSYRRSIKLLFLCLLE